MDMLKFLNEKLKNKQDFVTLLSDNNISPKIFMDQQDEDGNQEYSQEGDEDQEHEQEECHDDFEAHDLEDCVDPCDLYTVNSSDQGEFGEEGE
jgi:hypothetical protein